MSQPMQILQHQPLSPEAEQLAVMYQLGTPRTEYRVRIKKRSAILAIIMGIILGGLFGSIAFSSSDSGATIILLLIGLIFVGLALYTLLSPVIYRSWRVYICTDGFAFVRGSNNIEAFRWDQIEAMWQAVTKHYTNGVYTGTTHRYTIRRKDGRQIVLNDRFADVEEIGNTLSRAITNYLLPQVISAYHAGNSIIFGSLSVSIQGVSNGKELLPWHQIKEIGMNRGRVTVKKDGKWLNWSTVMVANVPNIFVFMALVNSVLKGQK